MPGRKARVEIYGWAFAAGKPLYFLFQRKGGKTVASVGAGRLARLRRPHARIKVPAKLRPGAYRLVLSTERRRPTGFYTWRKGRVVKAHAASRVGAHRRPRCAAPARRGLQLRPPHGGGGRGPS